MYVLLCIFPPKKTSTSEHSKVEHKSGVWLRRLQTAASKRPAMTFAAGLPQQLVLPATPLLQSRQAPAGSEPFPRLASQRLVRLLAVSSSRPPRRKDVSPAAPSRAGGGGTSAEHRCRWEAGGAPPRGKPQSPEEGGEGTGPPEPPAGG